MEKEITYERKKEFRKILFYYLDGIAVIPSIIALHQKGIINHILENPNISFSDICKKYNANSGYLNVAFRLLLSQGWIAKKEMNNSNNYKISITVEGKELLTNIGIIKKFNELLLSMNKIPHSLLENISDDLQSSILKFKTFKNKRIFHLLSGTIIGPILVANGMNSFHFINEKNGKLEFDNDKISNSWKYLLVEFLVEINFIQNNVDLVLTEFGKFICKRASAFGVTVSYLPLLCKATEQIFENPHLAYERSISGAELHVDRTINVWGSGGAHSVYFKKIDEIIKVIFNKPLNSQPKGIADMGCGNGMFLEHLYNVVKNSTLRGQHLDEFPLWIIGADFNEEALVSSEKTLKNAGINHYLIKGNIGDPFEFSEKLNELNIDLSKCLNVRSFLDHNRLLNHPIKSDTKFDSIHICGAFAYKGKWIKGNEVLNDFIYHISKWKPFIKNYGLILLELHTIDVYSSQKTLGKNASTAYDATHGFSDQYIIDFNTFEFGINSAGLKIDKSNSICFPNNEIPSISLSYIK
ncbi:MAG: class I SAM-dependent methyltransferase [Candidatus Marinimicrobia bacterium]|nr:class I SAM-dependent methyltransferase [Candidatus Neomarinimicrobiota bacterium]